MVSVLVVLVTSVPYALGFATQGEQHFTGASFNYQDYNGFLAMMRQGAAGSWLYRLAYTSEPHAGAAIYGFWLALGHVAGALQVEPVVVFHVARVADALLMFAAIWWLIRRLLPGDARRQRTAFVLAALASGLGWLGLILGLPGDRLPDMFMPEAVPFYTALWEAHYPLSLALFCVLTGLIAAPGRKAREWAALVLLSPALAEVKPYPLVVLFSALALFLLLRLAVERRIAWPVALRAVAAGCAAAPVLGYQYFVAYRAPIIADWWALNATFIASPPFSSYVLAYAWLLPCALAGVVWLWRPLHRQSAEIPWPAVYPVCWVVANMAWLYNPGIIPQRTFSLGLQVPLALLAALGWHAVVAPRLGAREGTWRLAWAAASTLTNVMIVMVLVTFIIGRDTALFLRDDEWQGLMWLRAHAPRAALVLAGVQTSVYLPAWTDTRVIAGHPTHTVRVAEKTAALNAFFAETPDPAMQAAVLRAYDPRYVWYGPREQARGAPLPRLGSEWVEVFAQGGVHIWEHVGGVGFAPRDGGGGGG